MTTNKKEEQEYTSYEEYLRRSYPRPPEEPDITEEDPGELGARLARESLKKVRKVLTAK